LKGDFSNYRYRPGANYISVLKQQGRVDLDSDWNEQSEITERLIRQLVSSLLGDFAVPLGGNKITRDNSCALKISNFSAGPGGVVDFDIGRGIVYAGGRPYTMVSDLTFRTQLDYPEPEITGQGNDLLVYLEIWDKTVSYIDDVTLREPALGGPDTCLRKKVIGQVKARYVSDIKDSREAAEVLDAIDKTDPLLFTLKIDQSAHQIPISFGDLDMGGGLIPGNLHFRVELHRGLSSNGGFSEGFKWSDENAATIVRILKIQSQNTLLIEETEAVSGEFLKEGDWVEISNEVSELNRQGGQMAVIESLSQEDDGFLATLNDEIHPLLRRFKIGEKSGPKMNLAPRLRRWSGYESPLALKSVFDLGRGIKATFHGGKNSEFRPGDFWTFAMRDRQYNRKYAPQKALPDGNETSRYPLAIIKKISSKKDIEILDCRKFFKPLADFA